MVLLCLCLTFHAVLAQSILEKTIMRQRQDTWDRPQVEMSSKRIKAADGMSGAQKNLLRMKSIHPETSIRTGLETNIPACAAKGICGLPI